MNKTGPFVAVHLPSHLRRFVVRSSLLGLILSYSAVIPLRLAGLLLPSVTWTGVVLLPAAWLATIPFIAILPIEFPGRRRLAFLAVAGWYSLVLLLIAWQGWF
jgi:hypothetical protein